MNEAKHTVEAITLTKDQAADFGQLMFDMVRAHVNLDEITREEIRRGDISEAYIREWQKIRLEYAALKLVRDDLLAACEAALAHVEELRDAWMRGAISECDGRGGTRSNRNVDVENQLRAAIQKAEG